MGCAEELLAALSGEALEAGILLAGLELEPGLELGRGFGPGWVRTHAGGTESKQNQNWMSHGSLIAS